MIKLSAYWMKDQTIKKIIARWIDYESLVASQLWSHTLVYPMFFTDFNDLNNKPFVIIVAH